jgi:hypothetical protein
MRTNGPFSDTPSVLWGQSFLLSVEIHNIKLHAGAAVCPYFDLTGLAPDTQFIYIWVAVVIILSIPTNFILALPHHASLLKSSIKQVNCVGGMAEIEPTPSKSNDWTPLSPCQLGQGGCLPCIYVGTGYFENVHCAKFLNPATGQFLFLTNMTVSEHFFRSRNLCRLLVLCVTVLVVLVSEILWHGLLLISVYASVLMVPGILALLSLTISRDNGSRSSIVMAQKSNPLLNWLSSIILNCFLQPFYSLLILLCLMWRPLMLGRCVPNHGSLCSTLC